ncbi:hypothetical protein LINPERHAP1_LOCUS20385 [Linum perenne]
MLTAKICISYPEVYNEFELFVLEFGFEFLIGLWLWLHKHRHRTLLAGLGFPINPDSNSDADLLFNISVASLALQLVVSPVATLYSTSSVAPSESEKTGGRVKVPSSENWTETLVRKTVAMVRLAFWRSLDKWRWCDSHMGSS